MKLCQGLEEFDISFFEEPIAQNDVGLLAKLRQKTNIPLTAGQNEGLAYRFRDLLVSQAVDIVQPNIIITGGLSQCLKIAGMASAINVQISNRTAVEYQYNAVAACEVLYGEKPVHKNGCMILPEKPGFGLTPNRDVVRDTTDKAV